MNVNITGIYDILNVFLYYIFYTFMRYIIINYKLLIFYCKILKYIFFYYIFLCIFNFRDF